MSLPLDILSILFAALLALLGSLLWRMHRADDWFDLRDILSAWDGERRYVSTSKALLSGAFMVSSYYIVKHPSETAFAAYLTAWVANGGIVAWRKTKIEQGAVKP